MMRRPAGASLLPYTTLFRSPRRPRRLEHLGNVAGHDAGDAVVARAGPRGARVLLGVSARRQPAVGRSEEHTSELQSRLHLVCRLPLAQKKMDDRKAIAYTPA